MKLTKMKKKKAERALMTLARQFATLALLTSISIIDDVTEVLLYDLKLIGAGARDSEDSTMTEIMIRKGSFTREKKTTSRKKCPQ